MGVPTTTIGMQSNSATIFRASKANKHGLAKMLDSTLRNNHDLRVFGWGFLVEVSSKRAYTRFIGQRYHYYSAMEQRFDEATGPMSRLWPLVGNQLRQQPCLVQDLATVDADEKTLPPPTSATEAYIASINAASEQALLGHFYCRYFADLFGGSLLGTPTRLALSLPREVQFYKFGPEVDQKRPEFIEQIYECINEYGEEMSEAERDGVVQETRDAFTHNAALILEQPALVSSGLLGGCKLVGGYTGAAISGKLR